MSRDTGGTHGDVRKSALWGSGNRGGEHRSSALWGKGGRGAVVTLVVGLMLTVATGAASVQRAEAGPAVAPTYVEPGLLDRARQNPEQMFKLIVQSNVAASAAESSFDAAEDEDDRELQLQENSARKAEQKANVASLKSKSKSDRERARSNRERLKDLRHTLNDLRDRLRGDLDDRFEFIRGIAVEMSGRRLERLARKPGLIITEDVPMRLAVPGAFKALKGVQLWQASSGLVPLIAPRAGVGAAPAIAIVDSGIDANRADFDHGARVVEHEVITSLKPNSSGDGRGHGTFVASIAGGRNGASPSSPLVNVDVMDDNGMALTSDVIAGAEWIYQNRQELNIRVANFSLHSSRPSNFTKDPLDRAVEKLWFGGVVVVAASGNYGTGNGPSGVKFAPANDPFVITVGALDLKNSLRVSDHTVPSWSAYGRTYDGFLKPEMSVSGRGMIGAIPMGSTLAAEKAGSIVAPGYARLSGTSFAAPVVAGAAAQILARHPQWTPDQVKGALMLTARRLSHKVAPFSGGVGEVSAWRAAGLVSPPNPNAALNAFVRADAATGVPAFDAVSWTDAARANVSWDSVSWSDVSWADVSWSDVSWSDVSWADVSWADVSWADVSWADVSWADVSWADVSWADVLAGGSVSYEAAANDLPTAADELGMTEAELQAALKAEPALFPVLVAPKAAAETAPVAPASAEVPLEEAEAEAEADEDEGEEAAEAPASLPAAPVATAPAPVTAAPAP